MSVSALTRALTLVCLFFKFFLSINAVTCVYDVWTGVRYEVAMDVLIGDTASRRGCLVHLDEGDGTAGQESLGGLHVGGDGTAGQESLGGHRCRSVSAVLMTFPDDIVQRRSVDAHWLAVFPVFVI